MLNAASYIICRYQTEHLFYHRFKKAFVLTPLMRIGTDSIQIKEKRRLEYFSVSLVYAKFLDFFTFSAINFIHYSSFDPLFLSRCVNSNPCLSFLNSRDGKPHSIWNRRCMQKPRGLLGPRETASHRPVRIPIAPAWRHPLHRLQASADPKGHKIDFPLPCRRIPTGTGDRKATRSDIPYHPSCEDL